MNDKDLSFLISGKERSRTNDFCGYRWCPKCGKALTVSMIEEKIRPHCESCGFIFYQNPAPAAGAIIVVDRRLLLVKRSVDPGRGDWCIPAGFGEWSEHPQQTAVRELKEETGLDISIKDLFDIFLGLDDPRTHAILILYLADVIGGKLASSDDALEARFFGFDELPPNIAFQAHRDALALYRHRFF